MSRYEDWVRWRVPNGCPGEARTFGRKVLGELMGLLQAGRLSQGVLHRSMPDGTLVTARYDGTTPIIEVVPAGGRTSSLPETIGVALWVPRGFVLYPASDAAPLGWGLPATVDSLRPGTDTAHWTPNGPIGDVLLTKVPGAGFPAKPEDVVVPLLWHPQYAQRPKKDFTLPEDGDEWQAYRLEFVDYDAQSPNATEAERAYIVSQKRRLFDLVQEQRRAVGVEPQTLPWRGFYDSAQVKAEMMFANRVSAHYSGLFPPSFRTPDGNGRDLGTTGGNAYHSDDAATAGLNVIENLAALPASYEVIGVDPHGVVIAKLGAVGEQESAKVAFDAWMDEPAGVPNHRWNIENAATNYAVHYAGLRGDCIAQHFAMRTRWLATGRRTWLSMHDDIPAVSWDGPSGLALAFETLPVGVGQWQLEPHAPHRPFSMISNRPSLLAHLDNAVVAYAMYVPSTPYVEDENGKARYYSPAQTAAQFGNALRMRGREFAMAPAEGMIWAAAVEKRTAAYRVIILTHHDDDQPTAPNVEGFTRYLRVWYCDVPMSDVPALGLSPHAFIRGVYADEDADPASPWDEPRADWHWKGGVKLDIGLVDGVGSEVNSLKYNAQWVPNHAGTQFVCLRDTGTLEQWEQLQHDLFLQGTGLLETYRSRAVVLTVNSTDDGIAPVLNWQPSADVTTPVEIEHPDSLPGVVLPAGPTFLKWRATGGLYAAGWTADDALKFCHYRTVTRDGDDGYGYQYVYWGAADADMFDPGVNLHLYGSDFSNDDAYLALDSNVMSVEDEVFFAFGMRPKRHWHRDSGEDVVALDPDWPWCWHESGAAEMFEAVMWRAGTALLRKRHPIGLGDGVVYGQNYNFCYGAAGTTVMLQPYRRNQTLYTYPQYATDGADWVFGYYFLPQPDAAMVADAFDDTPCTDVLGGGCAYAPTSIRYLTGDEAVMRGAGAMASFADEETLFEMVGATGAEPRLLNIGVV